MGGLRDGLGGGTGISGIEESMDVDLLMTSTNRIYFRDSGINIYSSADGKLTITSDGTGSDDVIFSGTVQFGNDLDVNAAIDLDTTTTSTNAAVNIAQAGTGKCVVIDQNSTGNPGIALEIDDEATGATNACVQIATQRTGTVVNVIAEGDASTVMILECDAAANSSAGLLIDRNNTGGTDSSLAIDDEGTGASTCVSVASKTTGSVALFDAEGAAGANGVVEIQAADGIDANPTLVIDNNETNGVSKGIKIDLASTGASFALEVTAVATDAGAIFTDGVATDCGIDHVGAVIRITNGTTTYYLPCLTTFGT